MPGAWESPDNLSTGFLFVLDEIDNVNENESILHRDNEDNIELLLEEDEISVDDKDLTHKPGDSFAVSEGSQKFAADLSSQVNDFHVDETTVTRIVKDILNRGSTT